MLKRGLLDLKVSNIHVSPLSISTFENRLDIYLQCAGNMSSVVSAEEMPVKFETWIDDFSDWQNISVCDTGVLF